MIWPDVALDKADLAFHRTLGGLRRTLEPDLTRGSDATAIVYHNDRYRLDPARVVWSDVAQFRAHIAASAGTDAATAIAALEEARALYRGDYLDDCPFYGDSAYVEERRELLRGQYLDVLLALARPVRDARRPPRSSGLLPRSPPDHRQRLPPRGSGPHPPRRHRLTIEMRGMQNHQSRYGLASATGQSAEVAGCPDGAQVAFTRRLPRRLAMREGHRGS